MTETAELQKPLPYMPVKAKVEDQNTPEVVLEPVRRIFGGQIDFDPCGNPSSIVGAKRQVWLPKWVYSQMTVADIPPGLPVELTAAMVDRAINPPAVVLDAPPDVLVGDGLSMTTGWVGNCFVNPPFNAETLTAFMERSHDCAAHGDGNVILLTKVKLIKGWHRYVPHAPAVCFVNRRLVFGGAGGESAPFDCALILWTRSRELVHRFALELDGKLGDVMFHL